MTQNKINGWRIASRIVISVMATFLILSGPGAWATPTTQQLVLAPAPGISCTNPTPGANGTFTFTCTLTGLTTPTDPSPSPSPSPTATPSPTVVPTTPAPTTPPPTPSPTATTTPAPSPSGVDCLHRLAACGFPNADNTGTVPGVTLVNSTRTTYATSGELIRNMNIQGCVEVQAANVTFRNVRIAAPCFWAVRSFAPGTLFEDVEITCNDTPGSNGYSNGSGGSVTLRRADIHGCENGLNVPGNTIVTDTWIHDLFDGGDAHTDGAQFNQGASNINFTHNTIDVRGNTTSAIIQWDEGNPQNSNVLISRNLLAGGAYTLYCARQGPVTNVRILDNRFVPGAFGYANSCVGNHVTLWSGNVLDSTGATVAGE